MKRFAVLAAAALLLSGCAAQAAPPPVSEKVQDYYDKNVKNAQATLPAGPSVRVAFMGDSYTAGVGVTSESLRWTTRLAVQLGVREVNLGRGGTGYLITSKDPGGTVRPNYQTMIAEAVKAKPDVVVVSGGGNDMSLPAADVVAAVRDFYPALRKALPKAKIIAVNPLWRASEMPAQFWDVQAAVEEAVTAAGGTFLDIGQPLVGHPELLVEDKVHPNDKGAAEIARLTNAAVQKSKTAAAAFQED